MDTDQEASLKEAIATPQKIRYEARFPDLLWGRKVEPMNRRMKERNGRWIKPLQTVSD